MQALSNKITGCFFVLLAYLFGEYRDNEIAISSRNNINNQK